MSLKEACLREERRPQNLPRGFPGLESVLEMLFIAFEPKKSAAPSQFRRTVRTGHGDFAGPALFQPGANSACKVMRCSLTSVKSFVFGGPRTINIT